MPKKNSFSITGLMLVKNEENWVSYAIRSVLPQIDRLIIYDSGSEDATVERIESINSEKINFKQYRIQTADQVTELRNKMINEVKTPWFMLIDGDEVWKQSTLMMFKRFLSQQSDQIWGVAMQTRNCVGDVYHFLPESAGRYRILGRVGHLTIRAYRKLPGYTWKGRYPLEAYSGPDNQAINQQVNHLAFFEGFYWHMTHLHRTKISKKTLGFRKLKTDKGIRIKTRSELPEALLESHHDNNFDPLAKRSWWYEVRASLIEPIKKIKWYAENIKISKK